MTAFTLGALFDWREIVPGEVLALEVSEAVQYRKVEVDFIASGKVAIRVTSGDQGWLVGYGEGHLRTTFGIAQDAQLSVLGDPDTVVYLRTYTDDQIVAPDEQASYTTIEPRPSGPSAEIKAVMHQMRINGAIREQRLMEQVQAMNERLIAQGDTPAAAAEKVAETVEAQAPPVTPEGEAER